MPDEGPAVVVVGGGISGLAAAHRLVTACPRARVTVLESAPVLGGKLALGELAGVQVDTGAEALLNRRPEAVELARSVGLGDDVRHPAVGAAAVWSRGALRPLPPTVLGVPADLAALARSGVVSPAGVARAALDRLLPGGPVGDDPADDVAVGRLVAQRLGGEVRDRLLEPLLGGIYAGQADELSLQAAAPQLLALTRDGGSLLAAARRATAAVGSDQRDTGPPNAVPVFAGLVGGVGRLAVAVADRAARSGVVLRTGATVRELVPRTGGGWRLTVGRADRPELVEADAVLLATPPAPTARLLEQVVAPAASELRRVDSASVALVSLAVPAAQVASPPPGSGFLVPPVERRDAKAVTWSSAKWSWVAEQAAASAGPGTVLLRVSFGRHRDVAVLQRDDAGLVALAVAELVDVVGLSGRLLDARVDRWGGGLPQYAVGHRGRVERVRRAVAGVDGLEVCGAAYEGVGVPACIADAQRAADRLADALGALGTMPA